jgi:hypothetical protein
MIEESRCTKVKKLKNTDSQENWIHAEGEKHFSPKEEE